MSRVRCEETRTSLFHGRIIHEVNRIRHKVTRIICGVIRNKMVSFWVFIKHV